MDLSKIIFIALVRDATSKTPRGLLFHPQPNAPQELVKHYLQGIIETFRADDCHDRISFLGTRFALEPPNSSGKKLYWEIAKKSLERIESLFTQEEVTFVCAPHLEEYKLIVVDRRYEHLLEKSEENFRLEH